MYSIYKITNSVNNKIYIGATRVPVEDRWARHLHDCDRGHQLAIYRAMRKYGYINFNIETIDTSATSEEELRDLETHYILKYNSINNGYNDSYNNYCIQKTSHASVLSESDVIHIRKLYALQTFGPKHWYREFFSNKLTFGGFEKIWEGLSWPHIMPEVYTKERLQYYKRYREGRQGEFNNFAIFKDNEVLEMRKYYINHSASKVYDKFGKDENGKPKCKQSSIEHVLRGSTYRHIPVYKKHKKKWMLHGEEVDIEKYNPVSTISESGE